MFTGIIQAVGIVRSIRNGSASTRLALKAPALPRPIALGASIAVNGVCLTVSDVDKIHIEFDVVPETLTRTTFSHLRPGTRVNLECSLRAGDGLDGHMVQGHIDGLARVAAIRADRDGHVMTFNISDDLVAYIIPKGSIAIDGVSLTIVSVEVDSFSVALIPTTLAATTLGERRIGDRVNIETDILARTIVTTLRRQQGFTQAPVTLASLRENGW